MGQAGVGAAVGAEVVLGREYFSGGVGGGVGWNERSGIGVTECGVCSHMY